MALDRAPTRIPAPPSTVTGDLYAWLSYVAREINNMPTLSYTSYTGGPESNLTGAPGDLAVNIVSSNKTARLYIKESGTTTGGWVSVQTM